MNFNQLAEEVLFIMTATYPLNNKCMKTLLANKIKRILGTWFIYGVSFKNMLNAHNE